MDGSDIVTTAIHVVGIAIVGHSIFVVQKYFPSATPIILKDRRLPGLCATKHRVIQAQAR